MTLHTFPLAKFQLILSLLLVFSQAQPAEIDACYQANFNQIDRMTDLPEEIVESIHASNLGEPSFSSLPEEEKLFIKSGQLGSSGIADRGGTFSPGCSPTGNVAMFRLVMAAANPVCILVAIEHGGSGHGAGLKVFLRENETWVRGDKFAHPRGQLMYQGKFETDLPTFISQANYELGGAFRYGTGVKKDFVESLKWYSLAANQGHGAAQFELGNIYAEGRGTEKNLKVALNWFEKAAKKDAYWEFELGKMYIEGKHVPQDIKIGLRKVKSAVSKQNPRAQVYMGELYLNGNLIKPDYLEAKTLFQKSLYHGGRRHLAKMYKDGLGVEKNILIAWALSYGAAYEELPVLEKQMSEQDKLEAKQLKSNMDDYYFTPEGKYHPPLGVIKAIDSYLASQSK